MNKPSIYVETSIISYIVARPSRDIVTAARQTLTEEWWQENISKYKIHISTLVLDEASKGNRKLANKRLELIENFPILDVNNKVEHLANLLITQKKVPENSVEDAFHIAIAAVHGMDYLLTWNFKHINNIEMKTKIYRTIARSGLKSPIICSLEELGGLDYEK
jgi:predicted nucleic acid-binding protein